MVIVLILELKDATNELLVAWSKLKIQLSKNGYAGNVGVLPDKIEHPVLET